jgi:hypothetical protein
MLSISQIDCASICEIRLSDGQKIKTESRGGFDVGDIVTIADGFMCRAMCNPPIIPDSISTPVPKQSPETVAPAKPSELSPSVTGLW